MFLFTFGLFCGSFFWSFISSLNLILSAISLWWFFGVARIIWLQKFTKPLQPTVFFPMFKKIFRPSSSRKPSLAPSPGRSDSCPTSPDLRDTIGGNSPQIPQNALFLPERPHSEDQNRIISKGQSPSFDHDIRNFNPFEESTALKRSQSLTSCFKVTPLQNHAFRPPRSKSVRFEDSAPSASSKKTEEEDISLDYSENSNDCERDSHNSVRSALTGIFDLTPKLDPPGQEEDEESSDDDVQTLRPQSRGPRGLDSIQCDDVGVPKENDEEEELEDGEVIAENDLCEPSGPISLEQKLLAFFRKQFPSVPIKEPSSEDLVIALECGVADLVDEIAFCKSLVKEKENKVTFLQDELNNRDTKLNDMRSSTLSKTESANKSTHDDLLEKLKKMTQSKEECEARCSSSQLAHEGERRNLILEMKLLKAGNEESNKAKDRKIKDLEESLRESKANASDKDSMLADSQAQLKLQEGQIQELRKKNNDYLKEISELKKSRCELQKSNDEKTRLNESAELRLAKLMHEMKALEASRTEDTKTQETLKWQVTNLTHTKEQLAATKVNLEEELEKAYQTHTEITGKLEGQIHQLTECIQRQKSSESQLQLSEQSKNCPRWTDLTREFQRLSSSNIFLGDTIRRVIKACFEALAPMLFHDAKSKYTQLYYEIAGVRIFDDRKQDALTCLVNFLIGSVAQIHGCMQRLEGQLELEMASRVQNQRVALSEMAKFAKSCMGSNPPKRRFRH